MSLLSSFCRHRFLYGNGILTHHPSSQKLNLRSVTLRLFLNKKKLMMETWLVTLKDTEYEKAMSSMMWWHLQEVFQQGKLGQCGVVVDRVLLQTHEKIILEAPWRNLQWEFQHRKVHVAMWQQCEWENKTLVATLMHCQLRPSSLMYNAKLQQSACSFHPMYMERPYNNHILWNK